MVWALITPLLKSISATFWDFQGRNSLQSLIDTPKSPCAFPQVNIKGRKCSHSYLLNWQTETVPCPELKCILLFQTVPYPELQCILLNYNMNQTFSIGFQHLKEPAMIYLYLCIHTYIFSLNVPRALVELSVSILNICVSIFQKWSWICNSAFRYINVYYIVILLYHKLFPNWFDLQEIIPDFLQEEEYS